MTPSKSDPLDPKFILIATPTLFSNNGLYPEKGEKGMGVDAYMNGSTEVILEVEFIARIKNQKANTLSFQSARQPPTREFLYPKQTRASMLLRELQCNRGALTLKGFDP